MVIDKIRITTESEGKGTRGNQEMKLNAFTFAHPLLILLTLFDK